MTGLIRQYRAGKITRTEFIQRVAKLQNIDASVKMNGSAGCIIAEYRGTCAKLDNGRLFWLYNGECSSAGSIKEFICRVELQRGGK